MHIIPTHLDMRKGDPVELQLLPGGQRLPRQRLLGHLDFHHHITHDLRLVRMCQFRAFKFTLQAPPNATQSRPPYQKAVFKCVARVPVRHPHVGVEAGVDVGEQLCLYIYIYMSVCL